MVLAAFSIRTEELNKPLYAIMGYSETCYMLKLVGNILNIKWVIYVLIKITDI